MKKIIGYLKDYAACTNKRVAFLSLLFTAALVFCNYHFGLNRTITRLPYGQQYVAWFVVFLFVFVIGYWLQVAFKKTSLFGHKKFLVLLLLAPAIFAWKMMFPVQLHLFTDVFRNQYWNAVIYWPFKVFIITLLLLVVHRFFDRNEPFYGVTVKNFSVTPYLIMLLLMMPLVAAASRSQISCACIRACSTWLTCCNLIVAGTKCCTSFPMDRIFFRSNFFSGVFWCWPLHVMPEKMLFFRWLFFIVLSILANP
jgi:hypothetical protein